MQIKAAIFDMDGTLIDSLSYWESFWKSFGKKILGQDDFECDKDFDKRLRTMIFKNVLKELRSFYHLTCSEEELANFSSRNLAEFYRNEATVKEGVKEFLEHLKKSGIRMCVASATEKKYILEALDYHGLLPYFEAVLSCDDIGKGKDQPDIYLLSLEALGVEAKDACVFEDSYVALESAASVGCQTVGIFDPNNYGQDRLKAASNIYLSEGETWEALIPLVEAAKN